MVSMLLVALAAGFGVSVVACALALVLFPWFRSGERKPGEFRPDQSTGGMRAVVVGGWRRKHKRTVRVRSSELPLVGGVAMVVAIVASVVGTGMFLRFSLEQWELLITLLVAMGAFGAVGFLDDWRKVYLGQGISEREKLIGVVLVSLVAAVALNRLVPSARLAYPPYANAPGLDWLFRSVPHAWVVFFLLLTTLVASTTSLAVDFSDGLDGLSGGLLVSAALSFAVIILSQATNLNWPAALILLAMVGALLGYLPFNWPSSYKSNGQGRGRRRARLIMGDTGALALGGTLALVTVITRLELLLLFIGGVFVLEGVSALISARILVKFFRKFLALPRFGGQHFAHTEFPLPFLATPMHHHYDLLGWDRQRLVYGAWTLGAGLATLGVASAIAPFTWERYLTRFVALVLILLVWQIGPWTRSFFIGLVPDERDHRAPARLGLFYGFPYRLFGQSLYHRVDVVDATLDNLTTPAERAGLWQRTSVFDARTILGYYCYRSGHFHDAVRVWGRIPQNNLKVRPEITELLLAARHRASLQEDEDPDYAQEQASAVLAHAADPSASQSRGESSAHDRRSQPAAQSWPADQHDPNWQTDPSSQAWSGNQPYQDGNGYPAEPNWYNDEPGQRWDERSSDQEAYPNAPQPLWPYDPDAGLRATDPDPYDRDPQDWQRPYGR
jgi:UDP-N-acetylmuramyl pentapeptide phosphotransferase/UDP-N-acetylglucosamine-1-phosphate transferase